MKILSLKISGYKNLKDKAFFDFTNCKNYVALIGLNGSGKSNVLEAISLIFSNLYHDKKVPFQYTIVYILEDNEVSIIDGQLSVKGITRKIAKKEIYNYLPTNVISSYSGEELRMWEDIYLDSYSDFFQDIKKQTSFVPKLLYINKFAWEYALIALLCSENVDIKRFIKDVLQIEGDVECEFTINKDNYGLYESNEALSLIKRIVELQSENSTIHINTINTLDIGQKNNYDFTKKLFYYLFITGMPVKGDRIKADKIIRKTEIKFNSIGIKNLSEGEKKLILIYAITNLLADEKTLVLLDEPDAHIHIDRKKEIIDTLNIDNHFTVFTTHSPTILNYINDENIRILRDANGEGAEVIFLDKIKALAEITNNEFSITDATIALNSSHDLLLVEGIYDKKYLLKAYEVLNAEYKEKYKALDLNIINCGGADNVSEIFKTLKSSISDNQLCFIICDDDGPGRDALKDVTKQIAKLSQNNNFFAFSYPKTHGFSGTDFLLEDYFPISSYLNVYQELIEKAIKYKDLECFPKPKNHIQNHFTHFDNSAFLNFKGLFDKMLELKLNFKKIK